MEILDIQVERDRERDACYLTYRTSGGAVSLTFSMRACAATEGTRWQQSTRMCRAVGDAVLIALSKDLWPVDYASGVLLAWMLGGARRRNGNRTPPFFISAHRLRHELMSRQRLGILCNRTRMQDAMRTGI